MSKTAANPGQDQSAEPTEDVVLNADHEHAGVAHKKGETITVPKRVADWLRSNGVVGMQASVEA